MWNTHHIKKKHNFSSFSIHLKPCCLLKKKFLTVSSKYHSVFSEKCIDVAWHMAAIHTDIAHYNDQYCIHHVSILIQGHMTANETRIRSCDCLHQLILEQNRTESVVALYIAHKNEITP